MRERLGEALFPLPRAGGLSLAGFRRLSDASRGSKMLLTGEGCISCATTCATPGRCCASTATCPRRRRCSSSRSASAQRARPLLLAPFGPGFSAYFVAADLVPTGIIVIMAAQFASRLPSRVQRLAELWWAQAERGAAAWQSGGIEYGRSHLPLMILLPCRLDGGTVALGLRPSGRAGLSRPVRRPADGRDFGCWRRSAGAGPSGLSSSRANGLLRGGPYRLLRHPELCGRRPARLPWCRWHWACLPMR